MNCASPARMSGRRRASSEGRLTGRSAGGVKSSSSKSGARPVARRLAHQHRERVTRDAQFLPQRRHQRLILRELALGAQQIHSRNRAFIQRLAHEIDVARILVEDAFRRANPCTGRGDGRAPAVPRCPSAKGARRRSSCSLRFRERLLLLDGTSDAAREVEHVAHVHAHGISRERRQLEAAEKRRAVLVARIRQLRSALQAGGRRGSRRRSRAPACRVACATCRLRLPVKRGAYGFIELRRLESRPPLLSPAPRRPRRLRRQLDARQRLGGEALGGGRLGRLEVRPGHARR